MTPADHYRQFISGVPLPEAGPAVYGDLSSFDYGQLRDQVAEFESHFEDLPAPARDAFGNDANNYMDFLSENAEKIDSDGLSVALRGFVESQYETPGNGETASQEAENAQNAQKTEPTDPPAGEKSS